MPVNAARRTIWLSPILSPAGQGTNSKHCSVAPDASNQHQGVTVGELVTCGREQQRQREEEVYVTVTVMLRACCT